MQLGYKRMPTGWPGWAGQAGCAGWGLGWTTKFRIKKFGGGTSDIGRAWSSGFVNCALDLGLIKWVGCHGLAGGG